MMQANEGLIAKNNLPVMQDWYIKRVAAYNGFDVTNDFSEGIALTAMLELLSNENINELNDIFYTFNNIPVGEFKATLENIQNKYLDIVVSAKEEAREKLKDTPKDQLNDHHDHLLEEIRDLINQKIKNLTPLEKAQLKVRSFIESIELLQSPESISELFPESDLQSNQQEAIRALSSKKVKSEGGVEKLETLTGFYDVNLLSNYLKELQNSFQNPSIEHTVCLMMSNLNSTITVAYIPYKGWAYVDSNHLPVKIIKDCDKVASKIIAGFGGCDSAFATHIYATNKNAADCKARLENFKKTSAWNEVNTITPEVASKTDTMGTSWLYIAVREGLNDVVSTLLNATDHIDKLPDGGANLLFMSTQKGYVEIVKNLIDKQAEIHPMALMAAAYNNDPKMTQLLLEAGADPDLAIDGKTPLMFAAENNNLAIIDILLPYIKESNQLILSLFLAAQSGHVELVEKLIALGVNPNITDSHGTTPLYLAALNNRADAVKLLLDSKVNANAIDERGISPLAIAAANGSTATLDILVKTVNNKNQCILALYLAAQNGHAEIAKKLYEIGKQKFNLDPDTDVNGETALCAAVTNNHVNSAQVLLNAGANSLITNNDGEPLLYIAAANGSTDMVKCLLAHNADVNQQTIHEETALLIACEKNYPDIVTLLINAHVDPNAANDCKVTPLLEAVYCENIEIVKLLLEAHANVNLADIENKTPLYIAAENGSLELVKLLIAHGADANTGENTIEVAKKSGKNEIVQEIEKALQVKNVKSSSSQYTTALFKPNNENCNSNSGEDYKIRFSNNIR